MTRFPDDVRRFVESTTWTFAKTYAATWPHEYVVGTPDNAEMVFALARHIFEHGTEGRFYSQIRKYHHEGGKVYWSMDPNPEETDLVNRCDEAQTYEARLTAGTLPNSQRTSALTRQPTPGRETVTDLLRGPMAANDSAAFEFLSVHEGLTKAAGTVLLRPQEMVLDVNEYRRYVIKGKLRDGFYEGVHAGLPGDPTVSAKWTRLDDRWIGVWIEDNMEYLFTFATTARLEP